MEHDAERRRIAVELALRCVAHTSTVDDIDVDALITEAAKIDKFLESGQAAQGVTK